MSFPSADCDISLTESTKESYHVAQCTYMTSTLLSPRSTHLAIEEIGNVVVPSLGPMWLLHDTVASTRSNQQDVSSHKQHILSLSKHMRGDARDVPKVSIHIVLELAA